MIIHSTYGGNTGTSLQIGVTISNVVVPSVVDGILVLNWGTTIPDLDTAYGAQNFTRIGFSSDGNRLVAAYFLPRPTVGTANIVTSFVSSVRGGVFAILLEGSKTTDYYRGYTGGPGTSQLPSHTATFASGDMAFDILVYGNRDTVGAPLSANSGQQIIHNTTVNSGGGANSYGFVVSYETTDGAMGYTLGTSHLWLHATVSLKNSDFNAPGLVTIRHAP